MDFAALDVRQDSAVHRHVVGALLGEPEFAELDGAERTSRDAAALRADTIPELEILTEDVRCTHGATVGPIDEAQRYYLESRGVRPDVAERLVVLGFFDEVLSRVPLEGTRERIREAIELKIGLSG